MENMTAYKLKFHTPLHVNAHGVGYEETEEIIRSDTIFSAIMSIWNQFYDDDIETMCHTPPFLISSAFPFKADSYFFPRPMVKIGKKDEDDPKFGKKIKKVKYISKSILENILKGKPPEFKEEKTFQKGIFWTDSEISEESRVFSIREIPRIRIDRQTSSSDIFYFSEVFFEENSGLFFLVRFIEKAIQAKFETILRLLGDEGIGGDKRVGKGLFTMEKAVLSLSVPENATHFLSLSLYYPDEDEFPGILENAGYNLILRRGWLHAFNAMRLRRQEVRMFTEGSVFRSAAKLFYGKTPCVLQKNESLGLMHNIYRYGFAFVLPIIKEQ